MYLKHNFCNLISAYCTGLLLARRVLKKLEMDEEYQGNIEVFILLIVHAIVYIADCTLANLYQNDRNSRQLEKISQLNPQRAEGHSEHFLMLVFSGPPLETVCLVPLRYILSYI